MLPRMAERQLMPQKPAHEDRYRWAMLKVRRVFRPTIMGNAC